MLSYPEKMLDILTAAISAIPDQVSSLVSDTLALFPEDAEEVVTTAVSRSESHHSHSIVDAAVKIRT